MAGVRLTAKQDEALVLLNGPQRHTMLKGGARSGKTFLFVLAILVRALKAHGSRHGIFRFRGNAVWSSVGVDTLPKVARLHGIPIKTNASEHFFSLPEHRVGSSFVRSEIWLGGLDEKERTEKLLGQEYVTVYENEASQISYASHLILMTRLAQVCDGIQQRHYADLNPAAKSHWTNTEFVKHLEYASGRPLLDPEEYRWLDIHPKDNAENLDKAYLASLQRLPPRQKLRFYDGVYQDEVDNALWTLETLDRVRLEPGAELPDMQRVIVAVDPSGASGEEDKRSDAIGINVSGLGVNGVYYVMKDLTVKAPPAVWGRVAVKAYHDFRADKLVAERNYGGAMVEHVIKTQDPFVNYGEVVASRGKAVRAEPIAAMYDEQTDRVRHVEFFPDLEDEMVKFSTAGYMGDRSPNRTDALVWALTELAGVPPPFVITDQMLKRANAPLAGKSRFGPKRFVGGRRFGHV
jgi:hypothetical protein